MRVGALVVRVEVEHRHGHRVGQNTGHDETVKPFVFYKRHCRASSRVLIIELAEQGRMCALNYSPIELKLARF